MDLLETGSDAGDVFVVALGGRALAERVDTVPVQPHQQRLGDVFR